MIAEAAIGFVQFRDRKCFAASASTSLTWHLNEEGDEMPITAELFAALFVKRVVDPSFIQTRRSLALSPFVNETFAQIHT
jgi:hypothetical protein